MTTTIEGVPYWELRFDQTAALVDDGGLPAGLAAGDLTDLYIFCHGWNNSTASARDLYQAMFALLAQLAAAHAPDRRPGFVGVLWPSLLFPEDDPSAAPAGTVAPTALAAALAPAFAAPQQADLTRIGQLLDERPASSDALREAHRLMTGLVTTPDLGGGGDSGERAALTRPTAAVLGYFAAMTPRSGDAQGLGDVFGHLWDGGRAALRAASYYEMKNRAGVVGRDGLGPLLSRLAPEGSTLRLHLLGHSFGARMIGYALTGTGRAADAARPVKSVTLIQGAFSHFAFADPLPLDAARAGGLAGAQAHVDGPLLATFSAADRANGWWYPAASMLARSDSESASDLSYRWGAMGHDGYQQADVTELGLQAPGVPYGFTPGSFYRLRSDAIIAADQSPFSGAHSDIRHPEVLWAVLAASLG